MLFQGVSLNPKQTQDEIHFTISILIYLFTTGFQEKRFRSIEKDQFYRKDVLMQLDVLLFLKCACQSFRENLRTEKWYAFDI